MTCDNVRVLRQCLIVYGITDDDLWMQDLFTFAISIRKKQYTLTIVLPLLFVSSHWMMVLMVSQLPIYTVFSGMHSQTAVCWSILEWNRWLWVRCTGEENIYWVCAFLFKMGKYISTLLCFLIHVLVETSNLKLQFSETAVEETIWKYTTTHVAFISALSSRG